MKQSENLFGKVTGFDPRLLESSRDLETFSLRDQTEKAILFFSKESRLISVCLSELGRGPDRILVKKIPGPPAILEREGWAIRNGVFCHRQKQLFNLKIAPQDPSDILPAITDFPGHTRTLLVRATKSLDVELKKRLAILIEALREKSPEALEKPLIDVIGYGKNPVPCGDAALCGMILTALAFARGKRIRVDWHQSLALETRRFLHRTSSFSAIHLGYTFEGRTTELQERFFSTMEKDYETSIEGVIKEVLKGEDSPGPFFLLGVLKVLDFVRPDSP